MLFLYASSSPSVVYDNSFPAGFPKGQAFIFISKC